MTDRTGLYVIATLAMFASIKACSRTGDIKRTLSNSPSLELRVENVIGDETPDKFYEVNGQRAYVEIDGKPLEGYLAK